MSGKSDAEESPSGAGLISTRCAGVNVWDGYSRDAVVLRAAVDLRRLRRVLQGGEAVEAKSMLIRGSEVRRPDHPIEQLLVDRWSPRAMAGEAIPEAELMRLFEAARWAPSSFNAQQWRALYAPRGSEHWPLFVGLLGEGNRAWAQHAAVLVLFISLKTFEHNGKPSITHAYDCGAAWENFALQGFSQGLVVHGMQGFDYERARTELHIPQDFNVEAMAAVGKPGRKESLPEQLQARESPNERRRIAESICEGPFCFPPLAGKTHT